MTRLKRIINALAAAVIAALPFAPAYPQLLGPVGQAVGDTVGGVAGAIGQVDRDGLVRPVRNLVRDRLGNLLRGNPRALEADDRGFPVVRGEVIAIAPRREALEKARAAGFGVLRRERVEGLDIDIVTLGVPEGITARAALRQLSGSDPAGEYALNHIYATAGEASGGPGSGAAPASGGGAQIGLIDTGVGDHAALAGLVVEQRGFAPGGIRPAAHGTAVASLLVGRAADFHGSAPGERLLVADVYGSGPTGGSAEALARALGWMAARRVEVVNVSLVGPPNLLVRAAVTAMARNGRLVVAAVGNDGPAASPLYPASYPGVVAVTGVDRRNKVLIEAGRGSHIDFAAPGADMVAASAKGAYVKVRGTSFAAPLVAGRLASAGGSADARIATLGRQAVDLGRKGPDPIYGRGLVCGNCRNMVNKTK